MIVMIVVCVIMMRVVVCVCGVHRLQSSLL